MAGTHPFVFNIKSTDLWKTMRRLARQFTWCFSIVADSVMWPVFWSSASSPKCWDCSVHHHTLCMHCWFGIKNLVHTWQALYKLHPSPSLKYRLTNLSICIFPFSSAPSKPVFPVDDSGVLAARCLITVISEDIMSSGSFPPPWHPQPSAVKKPQSLLRP